MSKPGEREKPEAFTRAFPDYSSKDVEMQDVAPEGVGVPSQKHFIVAIDFGTTFSTVSFVALKDRRPSPHIEPEQVYVIDNYPEGPHDHGLSRQEVPTESWYPKRPPRRDPTGYESIGVEAKFAIDDQSEDDESRVVRHDLQEQNGHIEPTSDPMDEEADDENSQKYFWGYEVQKQLQYPDTNRDQRRRVARSKLLLDSSQRTARIRQELSGTLQELRKRRLIKHDMDVIADFLEHLFRHTREQLTESYEFHDADSLEFVLCVPVIWTQKACRKMQTAMAEAIGRSGFGRAENGSIDNLFIVSEPEAAAARVLADSRETIMVCSCVYGVMMVG